MARTAFELIGQSGFGCSFDPLTEDSNQHIFSKSAKELMYVQSEILMLRAADDIHIFRPLFIRLGFFRRIVVESPLMRFGTSKFRRFIVDHIPWKTLHQVRDIMDVIHHTSVEIINSKKRVLEKGDETIAKQIGQGKDIISILSMAFSSLVTHEPHFCH